jgi:hypothetical protein
MAPLGPLDSFVQISFAVNTLFSFYGKISTIILGILDGTLDWTARHATAMALNLDDQEARGRVEGYASSINAGNSGSKTFHLWFVRGFKFCSFLLALYCIRLIHSQLIPEWLTGTWSWLLICPLPLYVVLAIAVTLLQLIFWGYKIWRLSRIAGSKPPPPFQLPKNLS